ncbi:MAG TPA: D-alanyl-D-alanine carboxypeptidase family protein [Candidatus Gracilibacteria bacterium]|nr:D-alanyl-D-alanine carboxypeptidase family protein [Candidatus Gracilibacteria bacterium]
MITAFLSLFAAGTLMGENLPAQTPHVMPWNEGILLEATGIPEKNELNIAPVISAKSAIVVDLKNGLILYEKNIHEPLPIASLTKLMTTVIILEENDPKEVATISKNVVATPGSKAWLAEGEKITVENLLSAALIASANDAAVALAEHNSENEEEFVKKMNRRVDELGLISTHFINATGLDGDGEEMETDNEENGDSNVNNVTQEQTQEEKNKEAKLLSGNYSTAYDLALLGRYAFGKSFIRRTAVKEELEVASTNEKFIHKLKNTNALLKSYLKVLGLKTGTTDEAGECLISVIENDDGHDILTVVLNSPSRYQETKVLADWTFRTYTWK